MSESDAKFIEYLRDIERKVTDGTFEGVVAVAYGDNIPFIKANKGNVEQRLAAISGVIMSMEKEPNEDSRGFFFHELYHTFVRMYGRSFLNDMFTVYSKALDNETEKPDLGVV